MNEHKQALQYIVNANGNATEETLIEDFEPIGELLLADIKRLGWVIVNDCGKLLLTATGALARQEGAA